MAVVVAATRTTLVVAGKDQTNRLISSLVVPWVVVVARDRRMLHDRPDASSVYARSTNLELCRMPH